jgi:hypothetical protein
MAPEKPPDAQEGAPEDTIFFNGFLSVDRASGMVPATGAEEGGEGQLVQPDQEQRCGFHDDIRFLKIVVNDDK